MTGDMNKFGADDSAASAAGLKICHACGADVTGKRRMRDSEGRYWCFDCGMKDEQRKHPVPCEDCGENFPEFELTEMQGMHICPKCANERRLRNKREAARIAASEEAARQIAERKRRLKLLGIAALCLVVLYVLVQLLVDRLLHH
jgi:hypothetical protein